MEAERRHKRMSDAVAHGDRIDTLIMATYLRMHGDIEKTAKYYGLQDADVLYIVAPFVQLKKRYVAPKKT